MSDTVSVTHSILSARAMVDAVLSRYPIPAPVRCRFLNFGLNDSFLVEGATERSILRVYRAGWRTPDDIAYELDVLRHLDAAGVAVAAPVPRTDGGYIHTVVAPEGPREAALFRFVPGRFLFTPPHEQEDARQLGVLLARIHAATDGFHSVHRRFALDLDYLVHQPLVAIEPWLHHRPDDWRYLQNLATRLCDHIERIPDGVLDIGFCHGDVHGGNGRAADDGTVTLFDFDCCCVGWRAYDLAVFRWFARLGEQETAWWPPFLQGYRDMRAIGDADIALTPYFVAVRLFWLTGLHVANAETWGSDYINDWYFDRAFEFWRTWEAEFFAAE